MLTLHTARAFAFAAVLLGLSDRAGAQASCTYEGCALWLDGGNIGQVVQGVQMTDVSNGLSTLSASPEPIPRHYRAARRYEFATNVFSGIFTGAVVGTMFAYPDKPEERWTRTNRLWLPATAVASFIVGVTTGRRAENHLRRAFWHYNRALARPAGKQSADTAARCSYDECALRLERRTWSTWLVQGIGGAPVARLGYRAPRLPLFAAAGDSARAHWDAYLVAHAGAAPAGRIFAVAALGSSALYLSSRSESAQGTAGSLGIVAYAVGHMSMGTLAEERRELERAIWHYNLRFATPGHRTPVGDP